MAETRRVWTIEEVPVPSGDLGQRQTVGTYELKGDLWHWLRPDDQLDEAGRAEWDRVMVALTNVNGEDLRHIVCFAGLLDHCQHPEDIRKYGL